LTAELHVGLADAKRQFSSIRRHTESPLRRSSQNFRKQPVFRTRSIVSLQERQRNLVPTVPRKGAHRIGEIAANAAVRFAYIFENICNPQRESKSK
jgi:hypothetical protein